MRKERLYLALVLFFNGIILLLHLLPYRIKNDLLFILYDNVTAKYIYIVFRMFILTLWGTSYSWKVFKKTSNQMNKALSIIAVLLILIRIITCNIL